MGYVDAKISIKCPGRHLSKRKRITKFSRKVIVKNFKKVQFIRKLLNKILSKASKDLDCYQLKKILYKNCEKMQEKLQSFVNASSSRNNSCSRVNTRKRKRNDFNVEDVNNTSFNSVVNASLCSVNNKSPIHENNISLSSVYNYDSDDTDEVTDDELQILEPKHIRVKQSLRKIAKIRKLPDYARIEKLLNGNDRLNQKKNRSLNSVVLMKSQTPFWNTYLYLLKQIENCIAKKYWSKLTTLLIYLSSAVKKCEPILLKATIINFISNPTSQIHELLEEFLKECYSCRTEQDIEKLLTQLFHIQPKINTLI